MITICKKFKFDAAHHLPDYQGKCHNIHGHTFHMEVEVSGKVQEEGSETGMIIDFSNLKTIVNETVIDLVDHTDLNNQFRNPTAENMVERFANSIQEELNRHYYVPLHLDDSNIFLKRLRLYETEDSYAEWRRDY